MSATATSLGQYYALAVVAGRERAVRERILDRLERASLLTPDLQIICPDEEVIVDRGTPERRVERRLTLPGYILLHTRRLSDATVVTIKRVNGVMGFLGGDERPVPLPRPEVDRILGVEQTGAKRRVAGPVWEKAQTVTITDGPLSDFTGVITSVDEGKQACKVEVEIFGRKTPAEVPFRSLRRG